MQQLSESLHADTTNINTKILFDYCTLNDLDPWDPSILRFLSPLKDPLKDCKVKIQQISKIINGQLFVYPPQNLNVSCQWRCLFPKSDYSLIWGNWTEIQNGTQPPCDIVEVECQKPNLNGTLIDFYKFLHPQIFQKQEPVKTTLENSLEKPDVHLIIFDSVSHSQFIRSMPKTVHMLQENYEAISFPHLNKIGLNSRPNGFAMLLGKAIYAIPKSPMSRGYESDYKNGSYCNKYLDEDQFIGFRFQDNGYVTIMSEDWALGLNNSYVIFMGDHGNRFGALRNTDVGETEDNNPFLFLSLPSNLKTNTKLTGTLKRNSKMLITHYDVYATFLDMAKPKSPRIPQPLIKGNTLFKPLPQPRTCDGLFVPFQYCICKPKTITLPKNNTVGIVGAELMVAQMNSNLLESNETNECVSLILNKNSAIKVSQFVDEGNIKVYQITYSTLPGDGQFWGYVSQMENNGTLSILSEKFPRLNVYAPQAICASKASFASYCFCKSLLNQTTTTTAATYSI
uniref:Uncharacterized protein n=1 Tax=Panagrolaimus sp. ES5 TaxID=591445 RepID=A0AC34FUJ9_9BILA